MNRMIRTGCVVLAVILACLLITACSEKKAEVYSVVFNLNGGELVAGELEQSVKEGNAAVAPEVSNGSKELSWDKDFSNITGNTIVNAVWTATTHTVTFEPAVDGLEAVTVEVEDGAAAAAPAFEADGMVLAGWDQDFSHVTEDMTVTAQWEKKILSGTEISEYADTRIATVYVHDVYDSEGSGSGFFIDDQGTMVTNYHVIEMADSIRVELNDGAGYAVKKVINCSEMYDLAILQVDITGNDYFELCSDVTKGEQVYAIGSALGALNGTLTTGIVSSTSRMIGSIECIQMDAAISHGNSGGPLLNQYGEVIGINSFSFTNGSDLNLAIDVDMMEELPEPRNLSINNYVEWWRTEIDRSYRPTNIDDEDYYRYSMVNTYQHVTKTSCILSANDISEFKGNSVSKYDPDYLYYFYKYDSKDYDEYVGYLKSIGFEYDAENSETDDGFSIVMYDNSLQGIMMMLCVVTDSSIFGSEMLIVSAYYY